MNELKERVKIDCKKLKEVRLYLSMSQRQFGEILGISDSRYSTIERQTFATIKKSAMDDLMFTYNINPDFILKDGYANQMILEKTESTNISKKEDLSAENDDKISEDFDKEGSIDDNNKETKKSTDDFIYNDHVTEKLTYPQECYGDVSRLTGLSLSSRKSPYIHHNTINNSFANIDLGKNSRRKLSIMKECEGMSKSQLKAIMKFAKFINNSNSTAIELALIITKDLSTIFNN